MPGAVKCPEVFIYDPTSHKFILMDCLREGCGKFSVDAGMCGYAAPAPAILSLVGLLSQAGESLQALGPLVLAELAKTQAPPAPAPVPPAPVPAQAVLPAELAQAPPAALPVPEPLAPSPESVPVEATA